MVDRNGDFLMKIGKLGTQPGMFVRPKGVAVDSEGHIYVADASFNNVQIFSEHGELMLYFGGGGFGPGRYYLVAGLYIDENDMLYIADGYAGKIDKFQYVSEAWKAKNPEKYRELTKFRNR